MEEISASNDICGLKKEETSASGDISDIKVEESPATSDISDPLRAEWREDLVSVYIKEDKDDEDIKDQDFLQQGMYYLTKKGRTMTHILAHCIITRIAGH